MNLFPLWNSIRIALISTVVVFFLGLFFAYYIAKLPRVLKGIMDVILTLPLVLPPTVVGYLVLRLVGPRRVLGKFFLATFGFTIPMTWWSAIIVTVVVIFPLMYRTARGAFESFDNTLMYSGQTLGLSNTFIFWRIRLPYCKQGIIAGCVLAFARALGEYGATSMIAGYIPGHTADRGKWWYHLRISIAGLRCRLSVCRPDSRNKMAKSIFDSARQCLCYLHAPTFLCQSRRCDTGLNHNRIDRQPLARWCYQP